MQDWISLLIAFILGFFMKHLLGTVCGNRLVEGEDVPDTTDCSFETIPEIWKNYMDEAIFNSSNKCEIKHILEHTASEKKKRHYATNWSKTGPMYICNKLKRRFSIDLSNNKCKSQTAVDEEIGPVKSPFN